MNIKLRTYLFLSFMITGSLLESKSDFHAKQDLDAIYHQIKDNHPGVYNEEDSTFNEKMEFAYEHAKQSLSIADNLEQQKQAITNFAKSFNDSHLYVHWHKNDENLSKDRISECFTSKIVASNIHWITLPTFALRKSQEQELIKIMDDLSGYRQSKAIVFDLRGNQGGNSYYGTQIVKALFGEKYVEQQKIVADQNVMVDWRASKDNADYLHVLSKKINAPWLQDIINGVDVSLLNQKPYYRELMYQKSDCKQSDVVLHDVSAKIFVIIDKGNVSAALDFIDDLKIMNYSITLIGQETKADRLYMEQRTVYLPSWLGDFSFPIKVYRNRIRKDNESYKPDIEVNTQDSEVLEQVVMNFLTTQ